MALPVRTTLLLLCITLMAACSDQRAESPTPSQLSQLLEVTPSEVAAEGELANLFAIGSSGTDLQRENKLREIRGKVVEWILPVYEVSRHGSGYRIQTGSPFTVVFRSAETPVDTIVYLTARNQSDHEKVATLKTGDDVAVKGVVSGSSARSIELSPAILIPLEKARKDKNAKALRSVLSHPETLVALDEDGVDQIALSPARRSLIIVAKTSSDEQRNYARNLHHYLSERLIGGATPQQLRAVLRVSTNGVPLEYASAQVYSVESEPGPATILIVEPEDASRLSSIGCGLLDSSRRKYTIKFSTDRLWASWTSTQIVRQPENQREKCAKVRRQ